MLPQHCALGFGACRAAGRRLGCHGRVAVALVPLGARGQPEGRKRWVFIGGCSEDRNLLGITLRAKRGGEETPGVLMAPGTARRRHWPDPALLGMPSPC